MKNNSNKTSLRIGGNMSENGADKAGLALAHYLGIAAVLFGISAFVWALAQAIH